MPKQRRLALLGRRRGSDPPIRLELTDRDRDYLGAVSSKVRTFTLEQMARTWWPAARTGRALAHARLTTLAEEGLLLLERRPVAEIPVLAPETVWELEMLPPDFGALSYRLQKRWNQHPVMTTLVSASKTCANMFSGHGGRVSRDSECRHDVHLSEVYLLYRRLHPALLPFWIFEERLRQERGARCQEMLPDVLIRSTTVTRAVEFGGAYSKSKLEAFHAYCVEKTLPYEIW